MRYLSDDFYKYSQYSAGSRMRHVTNVLQKITNNNLRFVLRRSGASDK